MGLIPNMMKAIGGVEAGEKDDLTYVLKELFCSCVVNRLYRGKNRIVNLRVTSCYSDPGERQSGLGPG